MTEARTIKFVNGKTYAQEPFPRMPEGVVSVVAMMGPDLISLYNLVASNLGKGSVKRFADNKAGAKRTWKLLCEWADQPEEELTPEQKATAIVDSIDDKFKLPPVQLSDADKKQITDEAAARVDPAKAVSAANLIVAEGLMTKASKGAAQSALRASPPASDNPTKDAEMPALRRAAKATKLAPKPKVYARRAGSKQALIVDLLSRPEGATFGELYDALAATGKPWRGVTIRSGLAWDVNHVTGYGVSGEMLNGQQFAEIGRGYEARRLGWDTDKGEPTEGYDPELKLAVYHLTYPSGMSAPLPHVSKDKD